MTGSALSHVERVCCVCGSGNSDLLYEIRDPERLAGYMDGRVQPVSSGERIVRCRTCGLQYVNPIIVWPAGSRAHSLACDLDYFASTRPSRAIGNRHLLRLAQGLLGRRGRWLDVGAGDGLLASQAQAAGWEAVAIEVDGELVHALGLDRVQPPVQVCPLEDADLTPASFDVISLVNVLEHVDAPEEMVATCARLLRAGGLLIVHVPNVGSLGARRRGPRWRHYEPLSHFTYFDRHTLPLLLERHGLEPAASFSLPGHNRVKRMVLAIMDRLGLYWHDGLGYIARK